MWAHDMRVFQHTAHQHRGIAEGQAIISALILINCICKLFFD